MECRCVRAINASTKLTYDHTTAAYHFDYICPEGGFPVSVGQKTLCTPGWHQVWVDTPTQTELAFRPALHRAHPYVLQL